MDSVIGAPVALGEIVYPTPPFSNIGRLIHEGRDPRLARYTAIQHLDGRGTSDGDTYCPGVIDQTVGRYYVHRIFTFNFHATEDSSVTDMFTQIEAALERTFAQYPMLSGYLGPELHPFKQNLVKVIMVNEDDGKRVKIHNFRMCTVDEVDESGVVGMGSLEALIAKGMPATDFPAEAFCWLPKGNPTTTFVPAFTLQATHLKNVDALVLGFAVQHTLTDGTALNSVIEAFVENLKEAVKDNPAAIITYKRPLSTIHLVERANRPAIPREQWNTPRIPVSLSSNQNSKVISPILVIDPKKVFLLKMNVNHHLHQNSKMDKRFSVTQTDCLSSLVWVAASRARHAASLLDDASQPTYFRTAVDTRRKLTLPLPRDYLGNMFEHAASRSTMEDMTARGDRDGKPVSYVQYIDMVSKHAALIRWSIEHVGPSSMSNRLIHVSLLKDVQNTGPAIPAFDKVNGVDFGALTHFGADLKFQIRGITGDGRPELCRKVMPGKEGVANILPRRGGSLGREANWELVVSLRSEHAAKMIEELNSLGLLEKVL